MDNLYQFGLGLRHFLKDFLENRQSSLENNSINGSEPVLEIEQIQGNILLGFNKPFQEILFFKILSVQKFKEELASIIPKITTSREVIEFRKEFRKFKSNPEKLKVLKAIWLNMAFTFNGLKKVVEKTENFTDASFKKGFLNQCRRFLKHATTEDWVVGVVFIIGCDRQEDVDKQVNDVVTSFKGAGEFVYQTKGVLFKDENRGKEHFGFKDGISQPAIRGRVSEDPSGFLIRRKSPKEPDLDEEDQDMIWPGEFVFGYPGQNKTNYIKPGSVVNAGVEWGKNSSYLVFARFTQNVTKFKEFLVQATEDLRNKYPSLSLAPEHLAAKLMGRSFEGEPLTNNDVPFLTSPSIHRVKGKNIDQEGLMCPFSAHIRKSYPKNDIDTALLHQHRILRRGIPFGDPSSETDEKGLLFLCYQTSIEKQFEHLFFKWMHDANFIKNGTGKDPILGFSNSNGDKTCPFKFPIQDAAGEVEEVTIELPSDIITLTGGEYFLSPSISSLALMTK